MKNCVSNWLLQGSYLLVASTQFMISKHSSSVTMLVYKLFPHTTGHCRSISVFTALKFKSNTQVFLKRRQTYSLIPSHIFLQKRLCTSKHMEYLWQLEHYKLFLCSNRAYWIINCLLCTNICTNKHCKFILNYSDMFRCLQVILFKVMNH